MKKRIGIIVSSHLEAQSFGLNLSKAPIQALDNCLIACCGRGQEGVDEAILHLTYHGIDGLISWGFAGGLVPHLSPGSLVLPKQIVHPFGPTLDVCPHWHQKIKESVDPSIPLSTDPIMHSDDILSTSKQKQYSALRTHGVAVDQESFYIASWGRALNLPTVVMRMVLDDVHTELPEAIETCQLESGGLNHKALLKMMVNPKYWQPMFKLKQSYAASQKNLQLVAKSSVQGLPFH